MSYKIILNGNEEEFDSLYEVNKKLSEEYVEFLSFYYLGHNYSVDYRKNELSVDGEIKSLNLPKNQSETRWINFRRNTVDFNPDGIQTKKEVYYMGFQTLIDGKNHKRMIKIDGDKSEIVESA